MANKKLRRDSHDDDIIYSMQERIRRHKKMRVRKIQALEQMLADDIVVDEQKISDEQK